MNTPLRYALAAITLTVLSVAFIAIPEPVRTTPDTNRTRWSILAAARFWLALNVIFCHIDMVTNPVGGPGIWSRIPLLQLIPFGGAFPSVFAFLVISGFSIAASLDRETKGFYRRRFWRIVPTLSMASLLGCAGPWIFGNAFQFEDGLKLPARDWLTNVATMVGLNDIITSHVAVMCQSWSMAIEVVFYIIAPLLWRLPTKGLLFIMAWSIYRYWTRLSGSRDMAYDMHLNGQAEMLWIWLSGFVLWRHRNAHWARLGMVVMGTYLLAQYPFQAVPRYAVTPAILLMIAYSERIKISETWARRFNWLGDISYPLYLIHFPVYALMRQLWGPTLYRYILVYPLGAVAASILFYYVADKPFRRFGRSQARAPASGPTMVEPVQYATAADTSPR